MVESRVMQYTQKVRDAVVTPRWLSCRETLHLKLETGFQVERLAFQALNRKTLNPVFRLNHDCGIGQFSANLIDAITEAAAFQGAEIDDAIAAPVEAGVDAFFDDRGVGVKLHGIAFDALDGAGMGGEADMRDDGEHGIGEILHHEWHAVCLGPAQAEQGAGLGFAGLQGHAAPAETAAEADELPIVGAFVEEQRLACGDAPDVDLMRLEIIREGLLDVERAGIDLRFVGEQAIGDGIDVSRVFDGAVEVGTEPGHSIGKADATDAHHAFIIPFGIRAAQLHLQAFQTIALDPVGEQDGVSVMRLSAIEVRGFERIDTANEMPNRQRLRRVFDEEILRVEAGEIDAAALLRLKVSAEIAVHELRAVGFIHVPAEQIAKGIMDGDVKGAEGDERTEVGHFRAAGFGVGRFECFSERAVDEIRADFHGMASESAVHESMREADGKVFHSACPLRHAQGAGPDP